MAEITPTLVLQCYLCMLRPPPDQPMSVVAAHFEQEHPDAPKVRLELVAVCPCGTTMQLLSSQAVGNSGPDAEGRMKVQYADRFWCPKDGNLGTVRRDETVGDDDEH